MVIDIKKEVLDALRDPAVREQIRALVIELAPPVAEELLDTLGAANFLHISPHAVRMASYRGTIPAIRVGRRLRFRRSELLKARPANDIG